MHTVKFEVLSW